MTTETSKLDIKNLMTTNHHMLNHDLDLRLLNGITFCGALEAKLGDFFESISNDSECKYFHPHDLTHDYAKLLKEIINKDIYIVACDKEELVQGYCFLRGWDEGWDIPSLGMCLHKNARGTGLSKILMSILHGIAGFKKCSMIRLTVSKKNIPAVALYKSFGYKFESYNQHNLVGFKTIKTT